MAAAEELLAAAHRGHTVLEGSRGRSTGPAPAQVAELAVREREEILGLDVLAVVGHEPAGEYCWTTEPRHADGRCWRGTVTSQEWDMSRSESCGKARKPMTWYSEVTQQVRS